ncbi:PREDICTED: uncharacterized protein LOC109344584 [Lupinus angustifolius]|uniref:uncharacterized protein LOC109344584 n=1 Tax=Lupinus angustifolius TaxID=3871 RepID=UPI00092EB6FC|nr:PREDICTED: uncharacterized protein LOC109344584 [Lupinus angustifolius]
MYVLSSKLRRLKSALKIWNNEVFGNIHQIVKDAMTEVESIQSCINVLQHNHEDMQMLLDDEVTAQRHLLKVLGMEEEFWREKSRINWHTQGDRNTAFFHRITKIRQVAKSMNLLRHNEVILSDQEEIANHALNYFVDLFASPNVTSANSLIADVIPSIVSDDENYMLVKDPSVDEIKGAVFAMNGNGAPGPDGFGGCFYQHYWDIVGLDVCNSVLQFFKHGWILPNLNSNNVVLVPKAANAEKIEDYRPIALAFDTLDWKFLVDTLSAFGFGGKFISWIKTIMHSAKLSVVVNGKSYGYFSCSRGVRQGDPLSPILFCLAEEVLSRGISKLCDENKISSIKGPRNLCTTSHVLYADDVFIFCRGVKKEILALNSLFHDYAQVSGQCMNLNKCKFYTQNASARKINNLKDWLGFTRGSLPVNYLGVPLFIGKPRRIHLQPLADRIINKLAAWKGSLLSIMGRVELPSQQSKRPIAWDGTQFG